MLEVSDGLPLVYGNDREFTQVIFNVLRNADTHTENGVVTICAELEEGLVRVAVSDTGTGIAPELLPHVFERGVHGDKGGSGFGLAICQDIISAFDGKIWTESDGHSGTRAVFTLQPHAEAGGIADV
jgi:signal transduction histidine kinase